ncbi:galectin [Plakobranchus ocellatus]|uniref:Galectin n=1 Tax=Plakobranchus ocellatus TaxID=259542 RepID=A0AAV4A0Y5_9GAST|nr:galectin [Plakobranchus ocellatus]
MGNHVAIPFSHYEEGGVTIGAELFIGGWPSVNYDSFSINLCVAPTKNQGDVALHFNPRYKEKTIVRNYKIGNNWCEEERDGKNVFNKGQYFKVVIKAHQQGYKVEVDGRYNYEFMYRIPREHVQYLHIEGQVDIDHIKYKPGPNKNTPPAFPYQPTPGWPSAGAAPPMITPGAPPYGYAGAPGAGYPAGTVYPGPPVYPGIAGFPQGQTPGYPGAAVMTGPIFNPPVPVSTPVQGGFFPGKMIYITGVPHTTASRFHVNLACGGSDNADLALHFDVRFNHGKDQNIVIRTSRQAGKYGQEERQQNSFPFKRGESFEIILLADMNGIKVAVNNQHFTEFAHRIQPIQRVDHVQVKGDVTVSFIRFQ